MHNSHPIPSRTSSLPTDGAPPPASAAAAQGRRKKEHVKVNCIHLRISGCLKESQNATASSTASTSDMSSLTEMRAKDKGEILKDHDIKTQIHVRVCPSVRPSSRSRESPTECEHRGRLDCLPPLCRLSVAVDTPRALVTSVLMNTETNREGYSRWVN
jgi:pyruvate/2-oxoglutarate dehydrogenase complex dihydrolipoamide acyltransferase (E2) component